MNTRRQLMATAGSAMAVAVAGCAGDSENGGGSSEPSAGENQQYAQNAIDVIDDNLGVDRWDLDDGLDTLFVDFYTSGTETEDLQVVGGGFAGAVDAGLSVETLAADALDADGSSVYIFDVEAVDAQAFMDDEISEQEYLDRIAATIE